ncbi:condensation domain-containing protein [Paenibacillus larvae]|uniref:condensation domain-containing protein n=1 Tax=Paenibacillus larvae TaxID=1464 RepID=UPI00289105BA|nr:condensation domain-containing protein [Paenibacillus larvae]MDT2194463.1 condensation domain-containing protein [Paenibacillus larvae]MDT2247663.1 condensation domain-containing protein [Paenibacillus larvae]
MDRSHTLVVTKQISSNKKEYWLEKFKNLNPKDMSIRLLTPKEEIQSAPIADLQVTLEPQLSEKLIRLSNHSDVTLFIVLLSAFVGFQYRYTGQEEIIVTVPAYNEGTESDSDSNELLMIRKRVEDDVCFRNLLIEMKEEFIKAIEYSDYPLTEIIEELNLDENRVRKWLHSTIFASENLHNIPSLIKKEETLFLVTCSRKGELLKLVLHLIEGSATRKI